MLEIASGHLVFDSAQHVVEKKGTLICRRIAIGTHPSYVFDVTESLLLKINTNCRGGFKESFYRVTSVPIDDVKKLLSF